MEDWYDTAAETEDFVREARPEGSAGKQEKGVAKVRSEIVRQIDERNEQMLAAARELRFELAAAYRDEIADLKRELRQMDEAGA